MCVGCKTMKPKRELIRVVKSPENEIFFDPTGKKNGRGAYICREPDCLTRAVKTKQLERALTNQISAEVYERLQMEITGMKITGPENAGENE